MNPINTEIDEDLWSQYEPDVKDALESHGWKLEALASGKTWDAYRLTKI